uniref:GDSL esterase/lipase n=1 Tax=Kalanchoe fedtschenkoi TaxID=63787 RepID=A0A7N0URZ8_KALFE
MGTSELIQRSSCILIFMIFSSCAAIFTDRDLDDHGKGCHFPAIFNFGDSNSDTGGLAATFSAPNTPFGQTFFGMPEGRFSYGRLIIDFIGM